MSGKDEPLETKGSAPLDSTPEETAKKQVEQYAFMQNLYVRGRVQDQHQAEWLRRYLTVLGSDISGLREMLVSDWVEEPEELAEMVAENGGHEHVFRLVGALFESRPDLLQRFVGRWMDELTEEVARRAPSTESHGIVTLLHTIENDWKGR